MGSTRSVLATLGLPPLMGVCALPFYTAQAPGCCIWSGPCVACTSSFWVLHKSVDSVGPVFCAFPGLSSSGSQELDRCSLPECSEPYPLHSPSLSFRTLVGCKWLVSVFRSWTLAVTLQPRPSRWLSTIQNLRKSLVRNWRPVCSLVGGAVSGAEFAPFPSPRFLTPVGMGRSPAG